MKKLQQSLMYVYNSKCVMYTFHNRVMLKGKTSEFHDWKCITVIRSTILTTSNSVSQRTTSSLFVLRLILAGPRVESGGPVHRKITVTTSLPKLASNLAKEQEIIKSLQKRLFLETLLLKMTSVANEKQAMHSDSRSY